MPATCIDPRPPEPIVAAASPATPPHPEPLISFLDQLLAEQGRLQTPVARFSEVHDRAATAAPVYHDLIPLTRPGAGQQYAFEVELDSCTGCKSCVSACHSLNGLDETETWRDTGLVFSPEPDHPFTQTITSACHHCADPGCLNGCPVLAYEKDPVTGIVRHLDDQCIGCSYCILKCPYDVPKYNPARGIVRKCDMCHGRLEHGEAPACVQACPTHAIRIVTVTSHRAGNPCADTADFLSVAPDPSYTQPTTRYVTQRNLPKNLVAADASVLRPQPAHWPLVVMLTLVSMAAGCGAGAAFVRPVPFQLVALGWLAGAAGLAASVLHLGQPLRAWRIFLGLRQSWLSREAVVFGVWFAASSACVVTAGTGALSPMLAGVSAALGLAGLFCSVMVYADTHRAFWRFTQTAPRFFGSALVLGLAGLLATAAASPFIALALALTMLAKLAFESFALRPLKAKNFPPAASQQTARLLAGPLLPVHRFRRGLGLLGGVALPLLIAAGWLPTGAAWPMLALVLAGEFAERALFFRAVVAPKMPGVSLS